MEGIALALITGAAHRLGKTFALYLARRGFAVLLHYQHAKEDALQTAKEIITLGVPAYTVQADLTNDSDLRVLLRALDELPHQIKILVNSASVMKKNDIHTTPVKDWDDTFAINLRAPFLLTQQVAQRMKEGGLIVNITDAGAQKLWTRYPDYGISKSALETLTRFQAKAYAPAIRVNAIAPGIVLPSQEIKAEDWEILIARLPLKHAVSQDEIAGALGFLMDTPSITGQVIIVDGGYSLI
jgi:NAD(P)-dependent dehydrogenase (short-subunit alcohol dehydrogenase family)